jgi:RHS repeat-associated protein
MPSIPNALETVSAPIATPSRKDPFIVKKLLLQLSSAFALSLFLALACRAATGNDNPTGVTGDYNGNITTGGSYDPYTGNAKRFVTDLTVTGSIGSYPLKWTRVRNTRNGFASAQLGQGGAWRHSYEWSLWIRPLTAETGNNNYDGPWGAVSYPDGRTMELRCETPYEYTQASGFEPMDRLVHTGNGNFDLIMQDGGRVTFQHGAGSTSGSYSLTATQIVDPYGLTTLLTYDSAGRLSTVTEPGGRYLQITYCNYSYSVTWNNNTYNYSVDVITKVEAFAGPGQLTETVNYSYTQEYVEWIRYYNLTQVSYDDGTHASYTYYPSAPATLIGGRIHTCDDVRYAGAMSRIEYEYATPEENSGGTVGQIKREKNLTTHQTVSEVFYPPGSCCAPWYDPTPYQRTETRPDGATRSFQYGLGNGELESYTDFKNQRSYIDYGGTPNGINYLRIVTDALGHATSTEKEWVAGAVMAVNHPDGTSTHYTYSDAANPYYMASRTDERGNTTSYVRDGSNRITRTDYPDLSYETFSYNGFGQVLTHLMTSGGTETFAFDTRGLKTTSYPSPTESDPDPWNHPTRYNYYQSGPHTDRLLNVVDPHGNATSYEYNLRGQVTKLTHQDGSYVQSTYNPDGTLASATDELGHTTSYTYDEYKRVLTVTNPLGQTTTNYYGLDWSNPLLHTTANPKYTLSPMNKNVVFGYDENFRKTSQIQAYTTADEAWTWFQYDAVGNLTNTTDPRGNVTTYGYDNRNRQTTVTNALNEVSRVEYDAASNKTKEIRPDNSFQRWEYDTMNRVSDTYGFANEHTHYDRNTTGTVRSITDAKGAVYTFYYDGLNRKVSEWYPADEAGGGSRYEHWYYDWAGNNYRYDNPAGMVKCFEHDGRNRIWHSYWWGNAGQDVVTNYDAASRVSDITTNWGETVIAYGYDNANRKVWEDQTLTGHPTHRVQTDPDADGNRADLLVVTNGNTEFGVYYDYTQRNQLAHILQLDHSGLFNYTYDVAGNMTKRQCVILNDSTNAPSQYYDALNRPTMWEQTGAGDVPFARSWYQYDSNNRETATWRDLGDNKGERFSYNPTNQLTNVSYKADQAWTSAPLNATRTVDYNYTPDMLNRSSVNDNGAVTSYTANAANQYTGITGQGAHYDGNFNLSYLNGGYVYYDADKRVTSIWAGGSELLHCTYDGLGRVVRRADPGGATLFAYDGWKQVTDYDDWNTLTARNVYGPGPDEILMRGLYWWGFYHTDKQGSVTALLDLSGNVVEKYTYDVFGEPTVTDGNGGNPRGASWYGNRFLFTGREYLAWIACYDYRNRMYRPSLGRFLQTDPKGFDAGDMNLFRYCADDPVDLSDPMGLYVTYSDGWSKADAENFGKHFEQEWADPQGRANWEAAYASPNEWRISPDRSSGSIAHGAERFIPTNYDRSGKEIPYRDSRSFGQRLRDTLGEVAAQIGIAQGLPKNWKPPTNEPQMPPSPSELPPGYRLVRRQPTEGYANGNWKIEKNLGNDNWQSVDPRTMKPSVREDTHVPFPPEYRGPFDY